jgi:hypothetical protein
MERGREFRAGSLIGAAIGDTVGHVIGHVLADTLFDIAGDTRVGEAPDLFTDRAA